MLVVRWLLLSTLWLTEAQAFLPSGGHSRKPFDSPAVLAIRSTPRQLTSDGNNNDGHEESGRQDNVSNQRSTAVASSRRRFFEKCTAASLTAVTALSVNPLTASAKPTPLSQIQSPLQDAIAPGHWIGQFLGLNSRTVTWKFENTSPATVSKGIVDTLQALSPERRAKLYMPNFDITEANAQHIHVLTWTKLEWLDTLDVQLTTRGNDTIATASFYATGFFPTAIPGAPLFNVGLFFIPFGSNGPREMLQDFRLRALEGLLRKQLAATAAARDNQ